MCFNPEVNGEDQVERCWTNSPPDDQGRILSTRVDSDESYYVTPIEE